MLLTITPLHACQALAWRTTHAGTDESRTRLTH